MVIEVLLVSCLVCPWQALSLKLSHTRDNGKALACRNSDKCSALLGETDSSPVSVALWNRRDKSVLTNFSATCPESFGLCTNTSIPSPLPYVRDKNNTSKWDRVFFLHMHKVAGTSLCSTAVVANPTAKWMDFCRPWYFPGQNESSGESKDSCDDWLGFSLEKPFPLVEIEPFFQMNNFTWHPQRDLCPHNFAYVTILRQPMARIYSHMCQHEFSFQYIANLMEGSPPNSTCNGFDDVHGNILCSLQAFDNFYIRSLLGPPVDSAPIGAITEDHLGQATAILEKFDAVVVLERPASFKQLESLAVLRGERMKHADEHRTTLEADKPAACDQLPTREGFLRLVHMNRLDQRLYDFGLKISDQRTKALSSM